MEQAKLRAKVLVEALPYIKEFRGKRIVIKYGGHAMSDPEMKDGFASQIALLHYIGIQVVVVHGGGPQIDGVLKRMNIESSFVAGKRVTDEKTLEVVEMVLSGSTNKEIVNLINMQGGKAVGLSGKDAGLIRAKKLFAESKGEKLDIGLVGEVTGVDAGIIEAVEKAGFIAIIAPLGVGEKGETYNINADTVASAIAGSLKAEKLIILTDEQGILDKDNKLISTIGYKKMDELIKTGVVTGGMIPKIECCKSALDQGVKKAHIIDGRIAHSILLELLTDSGIGTQIIKE